MATNNWKKLWLTLIVRILTNGYKQTDRSGNGFISYVEVVYIYKVSIAVLTNVKCWKFDTVVWITAVDLNSYDNLFLKLNTNVAISRNFFYHRAFYGDVCTKRIVPKPTRSTYTQHSPVFVCLRDKKEQKKYIYDIDYVEEFLRKSQLKHQLISLYWSFDKKIRGGRKSDHKTKDNLER